MARVTSDEVKEIITTTALVTPFITAANLMVTENLADKGLGEDLLKEIERWLAAHLLSVAKAPQASSMGTGKSNVKFHGSSGLGLDHTPYGQQVKLLDSSGTLAALSSKRAVFQVIGEVDADEYDDVTEE